MRRRYVLRRPGAVSSRLPGPVRGDCAVPAIRGHVETPDRRGAVVGSALLSTDYRTREPFAERLHRARARGSPASALVRRAPGSPALICARFAFGTSPATDRTLPRSPPGSQKPSAGTHSTSLQFVTIFYPLAPSSGTEAAARSQARHISKVISKVRCERSAQPRGRVNKCAHIREHRPPPRAAAPCCGSGAHPAALSSTSIRTRARAARHPCDRP